MGKKTQTKAGKASAPAKVPVKNSINLFIEEKHTGKNVAEIAIFAVFMVGVALFSKFCVQGKLDEMSRLGIEASRQTKVNLPSRIRMATLYAIAQSEEGGIVLNTSNLSEDWVGYCTIYGDSAGAFSPLGMYTTEEVIALGAELGLPERFLIKPPSDGLTGKTDEDNLGFTYHAVNEYIRKGEVDPAIKEQIDRKHKVSRFKFQTLPVYQNGLPIVLPEETDYYNPNKK